MEIEDVGQGLGLVSAAPCKYQGTSLHMYGIMLSVADVTFTSDIQASDCPNNVCMSYKWEHHQRFEMFNTKNSIAFTICSHYSKKLPYFTY